MLKIKWLRSEMYRLKLLIICLALSMMTLSIQAKNLSFPADVSEFIERRDGCDHFRGESPYNKEREQFLLDNMKKLCIGTDNALAHLRKKYSNNQSVSTKLAEYEDSIEYSE